MISSCIANQAFAHPTGSPAKRLLPNDMVRPSWSQEPMARAPQNGHTRISQSLAPEFLRKLGQRSKATSASFGFKETPSAAKQRFERDVKEAEDHYSKTATMSYAGAAHAIKPCLPGAGRRPVSPRNRSAFRSTLQESMEDLDAARKLVAPERYGELAQLTIEFSSERSRLPRGTTAAFYGAATSRDWPVHQVATPDARFMRQVVTAREYHEPDRAPPQRLDLETLQRGEGEDIGQCEDKPSRGGFDAGERLPAPTSPCSGVGGVPGLRKSQLIKRGPPQMNEPMNPLWKDSAPHSTFNRPFSTGGHWHLRPTPRKICA